jgi:hypothetical protein
LHRKRGKIRLARGDTQNAITDIRAVAKLVPDSTEAYLEISRMYYEVNKKKYILFNTKKRLVMFKMQWPKSGNAFI